MIRDPALAPIRAVRRSLSAQILFLTIFFVLIAAMIVLAPATSGFRVEWYERRIEQAYLIGLALQNPNQAMIDETTLRRLFGATGVVGVAYNTAMGRQERFKYPHDLVRRQPIVTVELHKRGVVGRLVDVSGTFLSRGDATVMAVDKPRYAGGARVEMYVSQGQLRRDLQAYALNILSLSLMISAMTGVLFYGAVDWLIVRPVQRLTRNMARFNDHPEEPQSVLPASDRDDELGDAERALSDLERRVQELLAQRRRLAALGAGIAKISHDLRNILASAQLMSDRLSKSEDPRVRSLSPRLVQALDRAVALSRDTLSYGRMEASSLKKTRFGLAELADEAMDDAAHPRVDFMNESPADMTVLADRTQLYRALFNLVRNAAQAIAPDAPPSEDIAVDGAEPQPALGSVVIRARNETHRIIIDVVDTGPGLPQAALERLFEPFQGSQKPGGSGLGVAIAYEIMRAHGGALVLSKSDSTGATFTLTLPN